MTMTPGALAAEILTLTPTELLELNRRLRDAGGPDIGVREPAPPKPPHDDEGLAPIETELKWQP